MPGLIQKIGNMIGAPEKGALATSAVLISLDLMGGSGLFSAAGAATGVVQSGLGKTICEALKGAIGGYLPAFFQNLDNKNAARENHTNFKLFVDATDNCLKEVRAWFVESYDLQKNLFGSQKDRKAAKRIFNEQIVDPILTYFTQERVEELFANNNQLSPNQFIEAAFNQAVNFNSPELMDYKGDRELIIQEFCAVFRKKFLDQIRIKVSTDPVLKDSYHTFLLHQILATMSSTQRLESQLTEVLLVLKQQTKQDYSSLEPKILSKLDALEKKNELLTNTLLDYVKTEQLPDLHYVRPAHGKEKMQLGFSYRYTHYVGRQDALLDLHDFINQPAAFRWAMIGGKAGQGKSRIAQEVCDVCSARGWHVGFWPPKSDRSSINWAQFTPQHCQGVLIVFDYIIGKEKEIKFILQRIALRMRELESEGKNPGVVRVMLLEREFPTDWLDSIQLLDHVGENLFTPASKESAPSTSYLQLSGLEDKDLITLLESLIEKDLSTEEQTQLLERLVAIDPEKRPLFAFILGLYLLENGFTEELSQWTRIEQPLKYILAREERDWEKTPLWQRQSGFVARTALFMAALTQKITIGKLQESIGQYLKNADGMDKESLSQLFRVTSHYRESIRDPYCVGLQPDLLAEYFVVRHFVRLGDPDESALLLNTTFKLDPEMVSSMLIKTEQNFRHHAGFSDVLHWLKERVTDKALDEEQAVILGNLTFGFLQSNTPKETDSYDLPYLLIFFEHIKHLQLCFPENLELARLFSRSAQRYNYYFAAKKDPQPEQALQYLVDYGVSIRGYTPFQTDPELAYRQVMGARNVIHSLVVYENHKDQEKAKQIFDTYIWPLSRDQAFLTNREIQSDTLIAIYLLVIGYTDSQKPQPLLALRVIHQFADPLLENEAFKDDPNFAETELECYKALLQFYCYTDPEPSLQKGMVYIRRAADIFSRFKDKESINHLKNQMQDIVDITSKFLSPPLWKKLIRVDFTNTLVKYSQEEIQADETLWSQYGQVKEGIWENLYLPLLNVSPTYHSEKDIRTLLSSAFVRSEYPPDLRYVKWILDARSFSIPFYKKARLYQVLCKIDSWDRYRIGEGNKPGPAYGLINLVHIPDAKNPYSWLEGRSTPIHAMNDYFNLQLDQPELVNSYIRFFCLLVQGDGGSFTLVERIQDVFRTENEKMETALQAIQENLEGHNPAAPRYDEDSLVWYTDHLIAYSSYLYKVEMQTGTSGSIAMVDDTPLLGKLPICSVRFLEGLMYQIVPDME